MWDAAGENGDAQSQERLAAAWRGNGLVHALKESERQDECSAIVRVPMRLHESVRGGAHGYIGQFQVNACLIDSHNKATHTFRPLRLLPPFSLSAGMTKPEYLVWNQPTMRE